jgi:hypothetical protein
MPFDVKVLDVEVVEGGFAGATEFRPEICDLHNQQGSVQQHQLLHKQKLIKASLP